MLLGTPQSSQHYATLKFKREMLLTPMRLKDVLTSRAPLAYARGRPEPYV
jgi:hypothetical protein